PESARHRSMGRRDVAAAGATVAIGPVPNHVRIRSPDARPRDRVKSQLLKSQALDSESRIGVWDGQVTCASPAPDRQPPRLILRTLRDRITHARGAYRLASIARVDLVGSGTRRRNVHRAHT